MKSNLRKLGLFSAAYLVLACAQVATAEPVLSVDLTAGNSENSEDKNVVRDENSLSKTAQPSNAFVDRLPKKQSRVIVSLGGGGCKVVGQIGVLRSLEKHDIHIDGIIGTSMGSVIGSMYCAGISLDEIEALFTENTLQKAAKINLFLRGSIVHPTSVLLSKFHLAERTAGLTSAKKYYRILVKNLPATFDELKIPFAAVATNITDGQTESLSTGDLPKAVMASNTVPAVFNPTKINGKLYVDGGLKANLPVVIATDNDNDVIIAVTVDKSIGPEPNNHFRSIRSVVKRVSDIMLASSDKQQAKHAEFLIYPNCDNIPMLCEDTQLLKKGIAAGEAAADQMIPKIKNRLAQVNALQKATR